MPRSTPSSSSARSSADRDAAITPAHWPEVRVRDDHLVSERIETAGHPSALGRNLDQNPGAGPGFERDAEALRLGADAPLDEFPPSART
jgi:hypothetical protein